jgi:Na+/melibiose symporter-like transporter
MGNLRLKAIFGLSAIMDQGTYQLFTYLVFTFYFSVVGLSMLELWVGFSIWTLWNMFNDPLFGGLSDRTRFNFTQRFGKRRFYITLVFIPVGLMMIFLFTPPFNSQVDFLYFLFIIILFEGLYTIYSVNVNALFPEMFPSEKERASTNLFVKGLTVFGLIVAIVMPTLFLPSFTPTPIYTVEILTPLYILVGGIMALVVILTALPFVLFGIKEKPEYKADVQKGPRFFQAAKLTLKNRTFLAFVLANTMIWTIFGTLVTIMPLFGAHVLKIPAEQELLLGIPLLLAILVAAVCLPIHRKIGQRYGMRNGLIITLIIWSITLIPFALLGPGDFFIILFFIITAIQGFGLAGAMFYVDILIGDIIDEDETKTGVRREGSYYGMNAFVHRISIIIRISVIALVFSGTGWTEYTPNPGVEVVFGLKALVVLFPIVVLLIAVLCLRFYPLTGQKLLQMRANLDQIHAEKVKQVK